MLEALVLDLAVACVDLRERRREVSKRTWKFFRLLKFWGAEIGYWSLRHHMARYRCGYDPTPVPAARVCCRNGLGEMTEAAAA